AFFVDGKALSFGKKLSFQDMQGQELAFIRQRLLAWRPTYEVLRGGKVFATIKKELFSLFSTRFEVDVPGPNDYRVEGDLFSHEYTFTRTAGKVVASVSKKWFSFSDSYGIDIVDGEDDVLILATAVVIDQVCHERKD
ncbi:MAG: LURP-one-related family protein, partial [Planctomycetota bacterium]